MSSRTELAANTFEHLRAFVRPMIMVYSCSFIFDRPDYDCSNVRSIVQPVSQYVPMSPHISYFQFEYNSQQHHLSFFITIQSVGGLPDSECFDHCSNDFKTT